MESQPPKKKKETHLETLFTEIFSIIHIYLQIILYPKQPMYSLSTKLISIDF